MEHTESHLVKLYGGSFRNVLVPGFLTPLAERQPRQQQRYTQVKELPSKETFIAMEEADSTDSVASVVSAAFGIFREMASRAERNGQDSLATLLSDQQEPQIENGVGSLRVVVTSPKGRTLTEALLFEDAVGLLVAAHSRIKGEKGTESLQEDIECVIEDTKEVKELL